MTNAAADLYLEMAGNIIPAIATANAMTAGLCVLQAFKVMREEFGRARMVRGDSTSHAHKHLAYKFKVFLERSAARVINTDTLKPPNPNCSVCGVVQSRLVVDKNRATLQNLVQDILKDQLGYGDEFSINNEVGILFDPELDENLLKKFSDLGINGDSFLTVIDDDDNPRVNLSLSISEQYVTPYSNMERSDSCRPLPEDSKPIFLPQKLNIPRKPADTASSTQNDNLNGSGPSNGVPTAKRKRDSEDFDDDQPRNTKQGKTHKPSTDESIISIDDAAAGAIVIEE